MFDLWASENSVLREKVLEHVFLAELAKFLMLELKMPFEVLRSEFDGFGYDVVIEARAIMRHVQLKATRIGGKRASVDVALALAGKPCGCVVWFMVDERTLAIGPFFWLGGMPGEKMPALGDRVTRHTRGAKGERQALREVVKGKFVKMETIGEVAMAMFGGNDRDHDQMLRDHLGRRGQLPDLAGIDNDLTWERSGALAYMIDGYELAQAAGLGEPIPYFEAMEARALRAGQWTGSPLELWLALFMQHRRDYFSGGSNIRPPMIDELCQALATAVKRLSPNTSL